MFGLLILVSLVVALSIYAIELFNKLNKSDKLNYINYSKTESEVRCTIEDYKYFDLLRK